MNGATFHRPMVVAGLLLAVVTCLSHSAGEAIRIENVRTGVLPERTRVVLDLSTGGVTWRVAEQTPRGAILLLAGVELSSGARTDLQDVGRIEAGELATEGDRGLRIGLRFHNSSDIKIFTLADPHRWVLDIIPATAQPSGEAEPAVEPESATDTTVASERSVPPTDAETGEKATSEPTTPGRPPADAETGEKTTSEPTTPAGSPAGPAQGEPGPQTHGSGGDPDLPGGVDVPKQGGQAPDVSGGRGLPSEPGPGLVPLPERRGPRIVVIDPGHGGEDPGATGPGLREKDVCLDVARRLHRALSGIDGVHPVLTRSRDVLVPLRQRMRLAEEIEADLFVSIHVNAAVATEAHGVEVFFLSLRGASDEATRELARLENEVVSAVHADTAVTEGELPFFLSLRQSDTLLRSSRAAETVLDTFVSRELAENRGVRQAAFVVLKSVAVPSILVELGFASSAVDREKLKQESHRQALADALADGIANYFGRFAPARDTR